MEQMPDMSFKPTQSPLSLVEEQNRLKQQALQNGIQRDQETTDQVAKVTSLASSMVQTMVSAAARRQMQQGLTALATTTTPQAPVSITTPSPTSLDQMGVMPSNLSPSDSFSQPTSAADNTTTSTPPPIKTVDQHKLALLKLAQQMAPEKFGEAVTAQAFPAKPKAATSLEQLAAQQVQAGGKVDPTTLTALNQINQTKGVPTVSTKRVTEIATGKTQDIDLIKHGDNLLFRDGTPVDPAKYTTANIPMGDAMVGQRRESSAQLDLRDTRKSIVQTISASPEAKTLISVDNALNQIKRGATGDIIMDKSTTTLMMGEVDKALSGSGSISEQRTKDLMPNTLKGKGADVMTYIRNHPQDRDVTAFLNNMAKELQGRHDQLITNVNKQLGSIISSASLAMKYDAPGYARLMRASGLDPVYAKRGKVKFLPGVTNAMYGEGGGDTGIDFGAAPKDDMNSFLEP